jgi:sulfur-oxidizing protein SoxY
MDMMRRSILKSAGTGAVLAAALAAGLLKPVRAFAADWNKAAFEAKDAAGALKGIGAEAATDSAALKVNAPEIAENGAVVPVDVVSTIPNTTSIAIVIEKNPMPLSVQFEFANGALPEASVRLKFAQTSMVKVIARADGKFYTAQREVKVTAGGCGG